MITQPATCRLRKRGLAVTAKARIAPMATNVKPVAVFMPIPSSNPHRMRFTAVPRRIASSCAWSPDPVPSAARLGRAGLRVLRHLRWRVRQDRGVQADLSLLAGLRRRTRDFRIHAEVVQRARDDRQGDRARLDAAVDGSVVVMALTAGDGANSQPNNEQRSSDTHYCLRIRIFS